MLFFDNPRKRGKKSKNRRRASRRRNQRRTARVRSTGGSMARRARKRRASSSRRRRRRRSGSKTPAVALRRRGVTVYRSNPRRRRYRRNPFGGGGRRGIVGTLTEGVKDGAVVLVSQVAARKAINLASGFNPIGGIAGQAITGLGVPVLITIAARKMLPKQAKLVSAAAFAEGMRGLLAQTPVGPFLADYTADGSFLPAMEVNDQLEAWPSVPQIGAYPTLGDDEMMVQ